MESTTPTYQWTSDCVAWLTEALLRLNMTYRDLDDALGYGPSRGSYTRQICERGRVPSLTYQRRLRRWWAGNPQPRPPANLLQQIQAVAVPWLRAREGQTGNAPARQPYTRRQAKMAKRRLVHHGSSNPETY